LKVKVKERNIELNKMKTFDDLLVQQLQDEEFKKEYEAIQPEMNEIRARVDVRTSQEK
jgi:predicted DNA binding CopG/RHH family protein